MATRKQISQARQDFAVACRLNGFNFREIGIALGGVSGARARDLFHRGGRRANKLRSKKGLAVPFPELVFPWEKQEAAQ